MYAASTHCGNDYRPLSGSLASRGNNRIWICISHVNCKKKVKVVNTGVGFDSFESAYEDGDSSRGHALLRAPLPHNFKGISAEFDFKICELVGQGKTPNRILSELIIWCNGDESKKERIPTILKIRARRAALTSSPEFQFETLADMMLWAQEKLITTKEQFDAVVDLDRLLVFKTFHEMSCNREYEDEPAHADRGRPSMKLSFGFTFSTKRLMNQFRDVSSDGCPCTHKLLCILCLMSRLLWTSGISPSLSWSTGHIDS